jgi:hypothetical protein
VTAPIRTHCGLSRVSCLAAFANRSVLLTLGACHDLAGVGGNVDTGDRLVMSCELILQLELSTSPLVKIHVVLPGYCERLAIGGEGVIRNGMVEEMVDFWRSHCVQ